MTTAAQAAEMLATRVCPKCGIEKSVDRFYRRPDGRPSGYCRTCQCVLVKTRAKERYWSDEEYREKCIRQSVDSRKRRLEIQKKRQMEKAS